VLSSGERDEQSPASTLRDSVDSADAAVLAQDGFVRRMCTRFSNADVVVTPIGGGTGRKLSARNGAPIACP
jgi:hypothetical protein